MAQLKYKRFCMPAGAQRTFIEKALSHASISALASWCGKHPRTVRDWRREKFFIDTHSAKIISKKTLVPLPYGTTMRPAHWYTAKGAKKGGYASLKKQGGIIGDPAKRLRAWRVWWEHTGKHSPSGLTTEPLPTKRAKHSIKLAEFCGIMLGDGGISNRQVSITLHAEDDAEYGEFVSRLTEALFETVPRKYMKTGCNAFALVVSRTSLVEYLTNSVGLVRGNKIREGADIPAWIQGSPTYARACMRGLMDTDGCVAIHSYRVNGKRYTYKKLVFTNASEPLIRSAYAVLTEAGMHPRVSRDKRKVWLDSKESVHTYFARIGSHNPKHLKRYRS